MWKVHTDRWVQILSTTHFEPKLKLPKKKSTNSEIKWFKPDSGCGSVGRAVASNSRGRRFKSIHWQSLLYREFTVNCIEKTKIKTKEAANVQSFKKYLNPMINSLVTQLEKHGLIFSVFLQLSTAKLRLIKEH